MQMLGHQAKRKEKSTGLLGDSCSSVGLETSFGDSSVRCEA